MNLNDALTQIATDAGLNADDLIRYAAEDNIGGRDTGQWSGMSTFADEGKVLYALIRALRPAQVVEVGVASGGTSTHILSALAANDFGALWSVDIDANCGLNIPAHLVDRWTFVVGDALTVDLPERADFIFEDGEHGYDFTSRMLTRLKALNPRMLVSHDYYTHLTYGDAFQVQRAFTDVFGDKGVLIDGAFTGLGYWVNPEPPNEAKRIEEPIKEAANGSVALPVQTDEGPIVEMEPDPIAAPKPTARKRKAAKRG
jgi:methyltransferase family protein